MVGSMWLLEGLEVTVAENRLLSDDDDYLEEIGGSREVRKADEDEMCVNMKLMEGSRDERGGEGHRGEGRLD